MSQDLLDILYIPTINPKKREGGSKIGAIFFGGGGWEGSFKYHCDMVLLIEVLCFRNIPLRSLKIFMLANIDHTYCPSKKSGPILYKQ